MSLARKLAVLSDAAKYDASCASSGAKPRNSLRSGGIGSAGGAGICHAYAPDGRCISLLKLLLTNFCVFDCAYCVNRSSSNVERARFSVDEVVALTMNFYRRNYIEGLFLSSGIIRNSDYTMEQSIAVARKLRLEENFRGYIHLKTIPGASQDLIHEAGLYADRLSINIELANDTSLASLAPEKDAGAIRQTMGKLRYKMDAERERSKSRTGRRRFAPAGQSTQMIVGADSGKDSEILSQSVRLYGSYGLRRVYYSAFSPIPDSPAALPSKAAPLVREHRLYQADWLVRFYGFQVSEIADGMNDGMLDPAMDPKLAWAAANRHLFPVDVNTADREMLLRVPGMGVRSVSKILSSRRFTRLRLDDVGRVCRNLKKIKPFVSCVDWKPSAVLDSEFLQSHCAAKPTQLALF